MFYTHLYAGDDGESHFKEEPIATAPREFAPPAQPLIMSEPEAVQRILFSDLPPGWFGDWHPSPQQQFRIVLSGQVEVTASDGEARIFSAGHLALIDDMGTKGHTTRVVGDEPYRAAFIQR